MTTRQLWGTDVYTSDSDLVAVLMHCGYYNHAQAQRPAVLLELHATVIPMPRQDFYPSCNRNGMRSRAWGATSEGCSFRVGRSVDIFMGRLPLSVWFAV